MSMISEGETSYEDAGQPVKDLMMEVIRKHGEKVLRIGRWALVADEVFVTTKTPAPKKVKAPKAGGDAGGKGRRPPPRPGEAPSAEPAPTIEAEPEQTAEQLKKPPHLVVLRWIKPPPAVQVHLAGKKLGRGNAQFLEVRTDLWDMMTRRDREAAIMTKLLEREIVDTEDGDVKVRKADLPIQTHPAVQAAYGPWWEHMDPESIPDDASPGGDPDNVEDAN